MRTFKKGDTTMRQLSITPSITVTIGRHTRQYFAFVTTAPADLDSPATVTLHAATFADVVGLRRGPDHARRAPRANTSTPGARRRDGARLAARQVPRASAPAAARGSRARRPQHAAALAVATPAGARRQPRSRHDSRLHSSASTARHDGELFRRSHHESSRSLRTTKATRPANSRMPSCTSPTACSTA